VRVTKLDGDEVLLVRVWVADDRLHGHEGQSTSAEVTIPMDEIRLIEIKAFDPSRTLGVAFSAAVTGLFVLLVYHILQPWAGAH
jgi:hypothetical protein